MSFINNTKKKILDNSDMYNYYKEGYVEYKSKYETLVKEKSDFKSVNNKEIYSKINDLNSKQEQLDNIINEIKGAYDSDFGKLIHKLNKLNMDSDKLDDLLIELDEIVELIVNNFIASQIDETIMKGIYFLTNINFPNLLKQIALLYIA